MTISGGFDFQIGDALLDMDIEEGELRTFFSPEYAHHFDPILANRTDISGSPGTQNLLPQFPLWIWGRWDMGEGNTRFNPDAPFLYDTGLCNPRIVGQLSGPPTRTDFEPADPPAAILGGYMTSGAGYLWLAGRQATYYSNNATSWTKATCLSFPGSEFVTAIASDGTNLYVALCDAVAPALGNRDIHYMDTDTFTSSVFQTPEHGGNSVPYKGMAVIQSVATPYLFAWTGRTLWSLDITQAPNVTNNVVFETGLDAFPTTYYADCVATDNSIAMFYSASGQTTVFEYKAGVGTPLWNLPVGFTGRAITHSQGIVFIAGTIGSVAALYALNLSTQEKFFIRLIRKFQSLTPVSLYPGNGAQILIGMQTGEVFIYDTEANSISQLDRRGGVGNLSAVCNYAGKRCANFLDVTGANFRSSSWKQDEVATTTSGDWTGGFFDFNLPEETKVLLGFHLLFAPIIGSETIDLSYKADEANVYSALATIDSSTAGASTGSVFIPVSDATTTVGFQVVRPQLTLGGGAVMYALTTEAYILRYTESWELTVRVRNERSDRTRSRSRSLNAEQVRDYLLNPTTGIVPTKQLVPFKDGARFHEDGGEGVGYTLHTVMVEQAIDTIDAAGRPGAEGKMRLFLRSVT